MLESVGTGAENAEVFDNVFAVPCQVDSLHEVCRTWTDRFSHSQLSTIRCRILPSHQKPTPGDLMVSQSLRELIDAVDGRWLESLLERNGLVTYFQPIVHTANPQQVFAFECLIRGFEEDGSIIPPGQLFDAARATGQVARLDHASRLQAIDTAQGKNVESCVFINFNPGFLDDRLSNLHATFSRAVDSGISPERFVFEVVESDEFDDVDRLNRVVDACRDAGCRVALDDMGTGYNSLYLMAAIKPDFIKLDRSLVRDAHQDHYKSCISAKLIELAKELNITTVVEGIETEDDFRWARDNGAEYCQGYLFARPAPDPVPPAARKNETSLT